MHRITQFLAAAIVAVALVYSTSPGAETAPTTPPPKADPKAKAKAKKEPPRSKAHIRRKGTPRAPARPRTWSRVNTRSKIYHAAGTRDYGKTKEGFYMCHSQADKSGFRPVKGQAKKAK